MSHYDDCDCPRCDLPLSAADRTVVRGPCPYAAPDGYCSCRRCGPEDEEPADPDGRGDDGHEEDV